MQKKADWVPWYRRKKYDGDLTEEEKRYLDSIRYSGLHPTQSYLDLSAETQTYIDLMEIELYDEIQAAAARKMMVFAIFGLMIFASAFLTISFDLRFSFDDLSYLNCVGGLGLVLLAWFNYRREWKVNADQMRVEQEGKGVPTTRTDEAIQKQWELSEIVRIRTQSRSVD
ncbi:MAG: hypothetical protein AAGB11_13820 [Pseudomonadota bacterium]